jgi:ATP-dependent RNA circularization protein (DNA/RNA ligase family)
MNNVFTYADSLAGSQSEKFNSLSAIIKHIENFGWNGDSEGVIFKDIPDGKEALIKYISRETGLSWDRIN